jgi:hypothetical protein
MKKVFLAGLVVALVGVIGGLILHKLRAERGAVPSARQSIGAPTSTEPPASPPPIVSPMLSDSQADSSTSNSSSSAADSPSTSRPPATGKSKTPGGKTKDPLTDPLARVALSLVGADLDAEVYWVSAINDPTLPEGERKDLIEDLNEEGFVDPKHPSRDELQLILSRLELIEELWPRAMDQTNWEAFYEAYKDLINLAALADGNGDGQPVN